MKRIFAISAIVAATLSLTSCGPGVNPVGTGLLGGGKATTNTGGNILGAVLNSATGATTGQGVLGNLLSGILGGKTTQQTIVGTWTYNAPSVKFESENVLSKIGGSVVSSKIENAMSTQLGKIGMKQGVSSITFDNAGNFTMALGSKSYNGTYTYDTTSNVMTLKGAFGLTSLNATVTVMGNTLYMLFDANKLLSIATKVGSVNSTLSGLLSNYNGIKLGWTMTK